MPDAIRITVADLDLGPYAIRANRGRPDSSDGHHLVWEVRKTRIERDTALNKLADIRELHQPHKIFDECGHEHEWNGDGSLPDGVREVEEVGLVCDDGYQYSICWSCCMQGSRYQTEDCLGHRHGKDVPQCMTAVILDGGGDE
jgi:hypothetical protein